MNRSIFKAYDIRGIYPTDINEGSISQVGRACAHMFNEGEIVVAHDARHGSPEMMKVLEDSILAEAKVLNKNITVRAVGLSTTPMFYFLVCHYKASGGAMVTASHNPKEYNGAKVVGPEAVMISGTQVLEAIDKLS
ncbi:MAG: hypothetical protein V4519_02615 [Patescibacteria group bacterium]